MADRESDSRSCFVARTLIETLIREDDLNFDRYRETVYDSGHAPPKA